MFGIEPSKYSIITSQTPQTSARSKTSNKDYIKLVTPSFHHSSFIRPVTEIMRLSCKHQSKDFILPISEIVAQHCRENAEDKPQRRQKESRMQMKKVENYLQQKQKKYRKKFDRMDASIDKFNDWNSRLESPIHRLMAVSRLGKEAF